MNAAAAVLGPPTSTGILFGDDMDQANDIARCLMPILDALGWHGNDARLFEAMPHLPASMTISDLLNTLANLQYEGRSLTMTLDMIDVRGLPCLFIPEGEGPALVVVAKTSDGSFLVFDGGMGEYRQEPCRPVRGQAVVFDKMERKGGSLHSPQPDWFRKVMLRFRPILYHATIVSIMVTFMSLISPIFVGYIYDGALISGSPASLHYLGAGMLFFVLADTGFRFLRSHMFLFVSARLGNIVGNEVFRRLLFLPPAFTETANIGSQIARVRDFESIREFFAGQSIIATFELPFMVILLVALAAIGGGVALVPIAAILIFVVFGLALWPTVTRCNAARSKSGSEKQTLLLELLANMRAVRTSGIGRLWYERYRSASAAAAVDQDRMARVTALINSFSYGLVMAGGLGTVAFGVQEVLNKQMSMGALVTCVMLVWRILAPLGTGFSVLTQVGRINKSIDQVNRLMNMPLEARQDTSMTDQRRLLGRIDFSDVSIRYSSEAPPALLGINLVLEKGQTLAVVGHEGAGKTTLLKLIMGLYTPQAGRVLIDHTNVRQMDPVVLRRSIAYVPKSDYSIHGTISQYLHLSSHGVTEEQMRAAAAKTGLLADIEAMPEGFSTRIRNTNLGQFSSSFQKRLSLTRALLRPSSLLLLDEPETGLSAEDTNNLMLTLSEMKGDCTIIIVTHDPSFFWVADTVLWLDKGRVKMLGPTAEVASKYLQ